MRQAFFVLFQALTVGGLTFFSATTTGQTQSFVVTDQQGAPLENAVVMLADSTSSPSAIPLSPAVMDQVDKQFAPEVLVIPVGQHVIFPNSDNIKHHVYSFSKAKTFELKLYAKQPETPITFEKPGVIVLGCNIHDNMVGYIVVTESSQWAVTNQNGQAELNLNNNAAVSLWHPQQSNPIEFLQEHRLSGLTTNEPHQVAIEIKIKAPQESSFGNSRFQRYGR